MDDLPDNSVKLPVEEDLEDHQIDDSEEPVLVHIEAPEPLPPTEEARIIAKAKEDYETEQDRARFLSPQKRQSFEE